MNLSVDVSDKLSPVVRQAAAQLQGPGRVGASQAMGVEVQQLVVSHLQGLAAVRHATAQRLGASPTNFLARAADAAGVAGVVRADEDGVSLSIRHPAVARAYRDITIVPKRASALTIPIHAMAYGRRAAQFPGLFRPKGTNILAIKYGENGILPLFALVRSVTQRRDPSLMPTADEINTAAARGVTGYIRMALQKARLSRS